VLKAYEKYPDRFYPMLSGFDPQSPNSTEYLEQQLATGVWKGLGEIYMVQQDMLNYKTNPDHPSMIEIYKVLAKYNVPIFFHYERRDEEGVQSLFREMKANPGVKFVWVHFANFESIEELEKELTENPNMYVELEQSLSFSPEQINLFEKFPDRFLLGTDMGCTPDMLTTQQTTYSEAISLHGKLLNSLRPTTAENLKYKNLERLMKT
jgi:predicted TIM-barrel fold metal-dependent hydrolase